MSTLSLNILNGSKLRRRRESISKPQMALNLPFLSPKFLQNPSKSPALRPFPSRIHLKNQIKIQISCINSFSDADLASDFASEVEKMNIQLAQREEAMEKSREMLFEELCRYLGMKGGEVEKKWRRMNEEEKCGLVEGFVSDWGVHFHPLSAKSVKQMVEDHLVEENSDTNSFLSFFPNLKKIMGISD